MKKSRAIIGEGETEWFYFESLRIARRYPFKLSPGFPQHADIEHIMKLAKAKLAVQTKAENGKKPTTGEQKAVEAAQKALDKLLADKTARENAANEKAEKQRKAIADVETELLQMLADPELRKRYFSIVDMDEIEENEFNLNIPRYVDTFEPEEQIDLKQAIVEFQSAMHSETETMEALNELLNTLNENGHDEPR